MLHVKHYVNIGLTDRSIVWIQPNTSWYHILIESLGRETVKLHQLPGIVRGVTAEGHGRVWSAYRLWSTPAVTRLALLQPSASKLPSLPMCIIYPNFNHLSEAALPSLEEGAPQGSGFNPHTFLNMGSRHQSFHVSASTLSLS